MHAAPKKFFISRSNEKPIGPFELSLLLEMHQQGWLRPEDQVFEEGGHAWITWGSSEYNPHKDQVAPENKNPRGNTSRSEDKNPLPSLSQTKTSASLEETTDLSASTNTAIRVLPLRAKKLEEALQISLEIPEMIIKESPLPSDPLETPNKSSTAEKQLHFYPNPPNVDTSSPINIKAAKEKLLQKSKTSPDDRKYFSPGTEKENPDELISPTSPSMDYSITGFPVPTSKVKATLTRTISAKEEPKPRRPHTLPSSPDKKENSRISSLEATHKQDLSDNEIDAAHEKTKLELPSLSPPKNKKKTAARGLDHALYALLAIGFCILLFTLWKGRHFIPFLKNIDNGLSLHTETTLKDDELSLDTLTQTDDSSPSLSSRVISSSSPPKITSTTESPPKTSTADEKKESETRASSGKNSPERSSQQWEISGKFPSDRQLTVVISSFNRHLSTPEWFMQRLNVFSQNGKFRIDLAGIPSGLYIIAIYDRDQLIKTERATFPSSPNLNRKFRTPAGAGSSIYLEKRAELTSEIQKLSEMMSALQSEISWGEKSRTRIITQLGQLSRPYRSEVRKLKQAVPFGVVWYQLDRLIEDMLKNLRDMTQNKPVPIENWKDRLKAMNQILEEL